MKVVPWKLLLLEVTPIFLKIDKKSFVVAVGMFSNVYCKYFCSEVSDRVCVCLSVCVWVCVYVWVYVYECVSVCVFVCVWMRMCMFVGVSVVCVKTATNASPNVNTNLHE